MKTRLLAISVLIFITTMLSAQNAAKSSYWVELKNKKGTTYQLSHPETFLSQRAIQRRILQNIPIDSTDLPVSRIYLDSLKKYGLEIFHTSKWLNGATVRTADTMLIEKIKKLPFVVAVQYTRPANALKSGSSKFISEENSSEYNPLDYGLALSQLTQLNGEYLHKLGFRGKNIRIAVLDAGFWNVNTIAAFDSIRITRRILGTRDFVDPHSDFYRQHTHGTSVLSCMGGNVPDSFLGTAPDASYFLFRSEDNGSEYIIEEDNWVAAAELADSIGADIINSSLGYSEFDDSRMNHLRSDLNGKKTRVTQGANMAFRKGILVVTSAGNEGSKPWKYIIAPSDGEHVLAVGAVDKNGFRAPFSSVGPAYGGAVKPNVAALGYSTYLVTGSGILGNASGTSFSSPVLAGMAACLLQANPRSSAANIKAAIEQSAHQYNKPDSLLGFGIPDFQKADMMLKNNDLHSLKNTSSWLVSPNPFSDHLIIKNLRSTMGISCKVILSNSQGVILQQRNFINGADYTLNQPNNIPEGLYILTIQTGDKKEQFKLIRSKR